MTSKSILLAALLCAAAPASALAFGSAGCTNLPEHDRAIGALEGMTGACDMSVEQARRILAQDGSQGAGGGLFQGAAPAYGLAPEGPPPRRHRRHHRVTQQ